MSNDRVAVLQERLANAQVRCHLCAHRCRIGEGKVGICGVRDNRGGTLYSRVYQRLVSMHVDPIEKKPLFHYYPGSTSFSLATVGCNFRCQHCQNWELSQWRASHAGESPPGQAFSAVELAEEARRQGCRSISYTYGEPTVFMEYACDIAREARRLGLGNVFVTNGYLTEEAVDLVAEVLDAANVDIKGMKEATLKREVKARPQPVLDCIRRLHGHGVWVEVTTLVVPGSNDSDDELREIARFIASVDRDIPWHLSRFHPDYRLLDRPPTPLSTLARAAEIGLGEGLRYVYTGNVWGDARESTSCPRCSHLVLVRRGFALLGVELRAGHCRHCGERIAGRWLP